MANFFAQFLLTSKAALGLESVTVGFTSAAVVTLPAVESGLNFRFVVANAFDTSNYIIDSAEGDNIDGILVVNGDSVADNKHGMWDARVMHSPHVPNVVPADS